MNSIQKKQQPLSNCIRATPTRRKPLLTYWGRMNKQEFIDLIWRLDEILMHRDYLQSQITECANGCGEEDEGLCSECLNIFNMIQEETNRLGKDSELDSILKQLKQACDADHTGEFQRILDKPRWSGAVH